MNIVQLKMVIYHSQLTSLIVGNMNIEILNHSQTINVWEALKFCRPSDIFHRSILQRDAHHHACEHYTNPSY